jgi:hypothetical protein
VSAGCRRPSASRLPRRTCLKVAAAITTAINPLAAGQDSGAIQGPLAPGYTRH